MDLVIKHSLLFQFVILIHLRLKVKIGYLLFIKYYQIWIKECENRLEKINFMIYF